MSESVVEYPKALYHYTTQSGLIGLVWDKVAWATNICYMNDAREFNYARELLNEAVGVLNCSENERFHGVIPFLRLPTRDVYPTVFVFSLSEFDDRLGLWRAYAGGAAGYSIGFSTSELTAVAERAGFRLVRCIYDKSAQRQLVAQLLEETRSRVNGIPESAFSMIQHSVKQRFWDDFSVLAATIKHPSFSEETEWRFVSDGMYVQRPIDGKEISKPKAVVFEPRALRVRLGPSTLTPYVELPLADKEGHMPIHQIRVGPSIDPLRAAHAVQMLLLSCDEHLSKGVCGSAIPYRTW